MIIDFHPIIRANGYIVINTLMGAGIGAGIAKMTPNGNVMVGILTGSVAGLAVTISNILLDNAYVPKSPDEVRQSINTITHKTTKKTRESIKLEAQEYGLTKIYYSRVESIKAEIEKNKIDQLTIISKETTIESTKTLAANYDLINEFNQKYNNIRNDIRAKIDALTINSDKVDIESAESSAIRCELTKEYQEKYDELQKEITQKINDLKTDTDENTIKSLNKSSIHFSLTESFNTKYTDININEEQIEECTKEIKENTLLFKTISKPIDLQTSLGTLKSELDEMWFFSFPKLAEEKKFYAILELSSNAKFNEIKRSYYKLSLKLHPDKSTGNEETKRIKEDIFNSLEAIVTAKKNLSQDPIPRDKDEEIVNALVYEAEEEKQERITTEKTQQTALQKAIWIRENCLDNNIISQDLYLNIIGGQLSDQGDNN